MNYEESLSYIHSLPRFPSAPGLERIRLLMDRLDNPQKGMKFIHVAGTNGKGSVCTFLASALAADGKKTGLYISPYIVCFRERIQINGEYISEEDLAAFATTVRESGIECTEFEFITAIAFLYYKYKQCDIVVLETGMGGRFDATNVIDAPLAAVITGIGLDHTAVLGETVAEIAAEKCGIIKQGSAVFTTYKQHPEALKVISASHEVILPESEKLSVISSNLSGNRFIYKEKEYATALIGEHQIENALLAIEVLKHLAVSPSAIDKGIAAARFPARLEKVSENPTVLLDGAHNPHGARALSAVLSAYPNSTAIIGMMADKNCDETLALTLPYVSRVITVTVDNPRSLSAEELADKAKKYCANVTVAQNPTHALSLAKGSERIFIFGSLYLASQIRDIAKHFQF